MGLRGLSCIGGQGGVLWLGMHRRKKTAIKTRTRCKNEKSPRRAPANKERENRAKMPFFEEGSGETRHRVTTYREHVRKTNTHTR